MWKMVERYEKGVRGALTTTLVLNGTVVTIDRNRRVIKDGAVAIEDNRIVGVGKTSELKKEFPRADTIDAQKKIVLPGLVDTHVHLTQTLARGLADDVSVPDWLYKRIFPYEVAMTEEDVYVNSLLACLEMIKTGTTCFADPGGYQMEHAARAVEESGIRGILAIASVDKHDATHPLPNRLQRSTDEVVKMNEGFLRIYNGSAGGRIRVWMALRGMLNVTSELILRLNQLAKKHDTGLEVHAAFLKENVEWVKAQTGLTDVRYLEKLGVLGPHWLMMLMGWVDDEEIDILKQHDVKISYNPAAAMKGPLGTNVNKKIPLMIKKGVTVSIGCDSTAGSNTLDMFRAMWITSMVHKEMYLDSTLIPPEESLEMATVKAARCLLWEDEIGSLEKGKKADLILVDQNKSNMIPMHDFSIIPNLVYSCDGSNVETVIINGKTVMKDKELLTIDEERVLETAQKTAESIINRIKEYKLKPLWSVS